MRVTLHRDFRFEAAHRNLAALPGSPQARLHGHSYRVRVEVSGTVDDRFGWLLDFADLRSACDPIVEALDHRLLNDISGMTDTSQSDVQRWLSERIGAVLPGFACCRVMVDGDIAFDPVVRRPAGPETDIEEITFGFAAAHFLPRLSKDHKCRRLHGHSFRVTIATRSSRILVARLAGIYDQLDHRLLNDVPGLDNPTAENLARWLWERTAGDRPVIESVLVHETCRTACLYRGED
jgi:6-pyruvoyltetrahydropterin/6-carboxytetrahydropterin synthase